MVTSVVQYMDDIVKKFPEKIAYVDENVSVTFNEFGKLAKCIGSCILQHTSPQMPVVVYMEKGVYNLTAFLGVASAGCFYVPIDSQMPQERMNIILDKLSPAIIIYDKTTEKKLSKLVSNAVFIPYESACQTIYDDYKLEEVAQNICNTDLLYVFFTSGSTGIPKGVAISHGALIDFIEWICDEYQLGEHTKFCNQVPFYFDVSVPDIYVPLKVGATTYIPPKSYYTFPKEILSYIDERNINTILWVPSALCNVVNCQALEICCPQSLSLIMFCGEVMPCKHLNVWIAKLPKALYVNLYGPTESTCASMYYNVTRPFNDDDTLPLGKACRNTRILLLDEKGNPVGNGEIGEICILGQGLSQGYFNDIEKTQKVFVQNPTNHYYPELMYKTGDLALLVNGEMKFAGRKDFQIKRLGHRIELGEIENVVNSINEIENACCLYEEEESKIYVFYVGNINKTNLRKYIREKLPRYMLPNEFVELERMPINLNGKTDRVKLKKEFINVMKEGGNI